MTPLKMAPWEAKCLVASQAKFASGIRISWRYFAAKKWNELANDIRIKAGTNEVKNKIRLLKF